jgi:hypothetical protein
MSPGRNPGRDPSSSQGAGPRPRNRLRPNGAWVLPTLLVMASGCSPAPGAIPDDGVPTFRVDPWWPPPLPENWILGPAAGLSVDSRDHVWIVSAPGELSPREVGATLDPPIATCCSPAPPLMEFDPEGNVVQTWDGRSAGAEWPAFPHGLFVDHQENVWIGSYTQHQVLKFTRDGEHLLTIGELDVTGGSHDPSRLGTPAGIWVDPETNEAFIADGYINRRVAVFDGNSGDHLRQWGAYGEEPDDEYQHPERGADLPPSRQFGTAHGLVGSNDGLLYLADRRNNRIQVFRRNGEFVQERLIAPATLASGSAFDVALSPDPEQRFLYLADGTNHKIWVLLREGLEVVGEFGRGGRQAGQFLRPHNIDTDSQGNLYLVEAGNLRIQRFLVEGQGTASR